MSDTTAIPPELLLAASAVYGVSVHAILGRGRDRAAVLARQSVIWTLRAETDMTLMEIGALLDRDHRGGGVDRSEGGAVGARGAGAGGAAEGGGELSAAPTAAQAAWICRCVQRLQRQYRGRVPLPGGDRGMLWSEYERLIELLMAEFRED